MGLCSQHPEKASLEALVSGLSPGSCWCSGLWPTAELWPLQWCSQPAANTHGRSSPSTPLRRPWCEGWGCPGAPLGCPTPDWGSGRGPGCQALPWWISLGSSCCCAPAWVSTCSPSNSQLTVAQHNCSSTYKPGFEPSGFYCHSSKCHSLTIRYEPN